MNEQQFDINKPITNLNLLESIEILKNNYNQFNQSKFFKDLVEANFLSPVFQDPKIDNVQGESELKDDLKLQLIGINNDLDENFLPVFSDWDELNKWSDDKKISTLVLKFKDYEKIIMNEGNQIWAGFVINPLGQNIVFGKEQLKMVNSHETKVEKSRSVMLGDPKEYPQKMIDGLNSFFPSVNAIKSAYLLLMVRDEIDKSFLIVVDVDKNENMNIVFEQISSVATRYLRSDEKIDFVTLKSSFGNSATENQKPFYVR